MGVDMIIFGCLSMPIFDSIKTTRSNPWRKAMRDTLPFLKNRFPFGWFQLDVAHYNITINGIIREPQSWKITKLIQNHSPTFLVMLL